MWRATIGDKSVHFDDLDPDVFVAAAEAGAVSDGWGEVYLWPLRYPTAARALIATIAEQFGVEPPPLKTVRELRACYEREEVDLPDAYEGGSPLAEDDPTTAG